MAGRALSTHLFLKRRKRHLWAADDQNLEEFAHFSLAGAGQPVDIETDAFLRYRVLGVGEDGGPFDQAKAGQEVALIGQAIDLKTFGQRPAAELLEINMAGDVGFPGCFRGGS